MIIKKEMSIDEFEPWSGAVHTYDYLSNNDLLEELENVLEELEEGEMTDTEFNDLLWFESDWIFEMLGIKTYDKIKEEISELQEEISSLKRELSQDEYEMIAACDMDMIDYINDAKSEIDEKLEEIDELKKDLENAPI